MALPRQLLLSDLLRLRVRSEKGLDLGPGLQGWMHPPTHRLLGWASRPSAFGSRRLVWRLNQLRGISDQEAFVKGEPAETDPTTLRRLPSLFDAALIGADGLPLATVADAAVELRTGRIQHYLVSRSDPRLPGGSRWRLSPERIVDQQPGRVLTALSHLDDLPLARASVRQEFLQRSRRWRERMDQESSRWRERFQHAGGELEDRLEGWLEEPPWEQAGGRDRRAPFRADGSEESDPGDRRSSPQPLDDPLENWEEEEGRADPPAGRGGRPPRRDRRADAESVVEDDWV
jgi:sporulation protein YlmC with PRC-barrel domain